MNALQKFGYAILAILLVLIFGDLAFLKTIEPWQDLIVFAFLLLVFVVSISLAAFKVDEGTGTAFKFLGKYACSIMSLKRFHFGDNEFIEPGSGVDSTNRNWFIWRLGGWVLYIKWLIEPTKYADQNNDDGFGREYSVFLNQIQRDFTLKNAETIKGEEIPLNLRGTFKIEVVNIYQFLYIAPKDVITRVIEIMESLTRSWTKGNFYDTIQQVKSDGGRMWDQLGSNIQTSIRKTREEWGIKILEDSIFIMDVGLLPEDQQAYAAKKRQQLKTIAGAQEVLGGMLDVAALSMGFKGDDATKKTAIDQVVEVLSKDDAGKTKLELMVAKANQVVVQKALGVKPFLFGNVDGSPLDPITAALASLISRAMGGSVPSQNPPSETEKTEKNPQKTFREEVAEFEKKQK